ncbi:MAG: heavy metal-associated domain-containing protein, partial [Curvibacter sp.]
MNSASLAASPALPAGAAATSATGGAGEGLLDDPQLWSAFSRPLPGASETAGHWESHLLIEGMHCAACALNVEDALRRVPGVQSASVSSGSRRARVLWDAGAVRPSEWMQAVR